MVKTKQNKKKNKTVSIKQNKNELHRLKAELI